MNYFTPELIERYGSTDPVIANAADAEWETVHEQYTRRIEELEPTLPENIRALTSLLLHDAAVQSIARDRDRLLMVLKKDIPPRDVVILAYELTDEPVLVPFARKPRDWQASTWFDFDEFDRVEDGERPAYMQNIVFGNGWELRLSFRDVRVTVAEPWTPTPSLTPLAMVQATGAQTA